MKHKLKTRNVLLAALWVGACADDSLSPSAVTARTQALQSTGLVISEVYPVGGFSAASAFKNDFVELHNIGTSDQSLAGLSVQIGRATDWVVTSLPDASVPPGGFFLIQYGGSDLGVNALPAPDLAVNPPPAGSLLASAQGRVALVVGDTILPSTCPIDAGDLLVDFVGYANPADSGTCFLGTGAAASSVSQAVARKDGGIHCSNANDNALDFERSAPTPQNTSSAPVQCTQVIDAGIDAGVDAGSTVDAGTPVVDAGDRDAGNADAGNADAGQTDAGTSDSGQSEVDSGNPQDKDAGLQPVADAGTVRPDAGPQPDGAFQGNGCACNSGTAGLFALVGLATLLRRARGKLQR